MSIINAEGLCKEFKIIKRGKGFSGTVRGLFKREYEKKVAVDNISLKVEKGEILGYIGPNGAGKSTTIKMLCGILVPTSGKIEVGGMVPFQNRIANSRRIGVVFGQRTQLWWDLPVIESVELCKYLYNIPDGIFKENKKIFFDILGISEFQNFPVRQLSLGQRMRADICCALLHNPDILYLDEPTVGLDVSVKKKIREFIQEINRSRNVTVMLTTHDVKDIEALCSRVVVIDKGKLVFNGGLDDLRRKYSKTGKILLEVAADSTDLCLLSKAIGNDSVKISIVKDKVMIEYPKDRIGSMGILKSVIGSFPIEDVVVMEDDIEEIVRAFYEK